MQDKKEEKKAGKVINSLVKNTRMTPDKAKSAVQTLKQDEPKRIPENKKITNYASFGAIIEQNNNIII